jgi:hypothetical protein
MIPCSSQDDCHQLISLHKLTYIIGDVSKTDIKIRKLTDTHTDTQRYKECKENLQIYIDEIKKANWDEVINKLRQFIKLGGKKTKKTRMNKNIKIIIHDDILDEISNCCYIMR